MIFYKKIHHLSIKYLPLYTEFLKDEQYVGLQKKYLNTAFIIWEYDKRKTRSPTKMPATKLVGATKMLAYEYLQSKKRNKATVKFNKGNAKCECYNGEEIEDSRYYYFFIGEKILSWFWWKLEFTSGIQQSDQKKTPVEYFVKKFNKWRESKPDPFFERFYTVGNPSVSKYEILLNLTSFIKKYRIQFKSSMLETIKKHIETVTDYEAEYIYKLRKNMIEYFVQYLEYHKNTTKEDKWDKDLKLLEELVELNEDTYKQVNAQNDTSSDGSNSSDDWLKNYGD